MLKIREIRKERGLTQEQLASRLGVARSLISKYESGAVDPTFGQLCKIASILSVDVTQLLPSSLLSDMRSSGVSDDAINSESAKYTVNNDFLDILLSANLIPLPRMDSIPLLGAIACGSPIMAEENVEAILAKPEHIAADFCLRCRGDSMINARIFDGDIVYIRSQPQVEDGEIAAVLIGEEATLKRVRLFPDHVSLEPENPQYRPLVYWGADMEAVRILGKAVAFTSAVR